ncbi:hypothetical protein JCM30237_12360 [Halolamina litorea]|uniref:Uncharacterized protein n=1 Tax=Halolamina litorea TaxID=1515593 RepID=A0ABD6BLJ5_9EURY|nr:hypothetical protein [Halolamina litorea]
MAETLSNLGTQKVEATEKTNVPGQMTDILAFSPIDSILLILSNRGGGIPFRFDLRDSNNDPLPQDTELEIVYNAPHFQRPQTVSETLGNISTYNRLSIKEQQNEDYIEQTRISLNGNRLEVRDIDTASVAINSSEQIDWSNSRAYVDKDNVTTRQEA